MCVNTYLNFQRGPDNIPVSSKGHFAGPRSRTLSGTGSDLKLVFSIVIQVGKNCFSLGGGSCQLVLWHQTFPQVNVIHGDLKKKSEEKNQYENP